MNFKLLSLGAGIAALAAGAAFAGDTPAGEAPRVERQVIVVCDGGPGGAQHAGGPGGHAGMHGRMDANSDGAITRDEFRAMHDEMFAKLDKNRDGKLSGDEFGHHGGPGEENIEIRVDGPGPHGPGGPGMHGCGGPDMAWDERAGPDGDNVRIIRHGPGDGPDEMDKNSDGKLSFEEFSAPMRDHFNEADKNHDGFLDKDEMGGDHVFMFRHSDRR